ncbi:hypothetical protein F5887DRAFT_1126325 [Amanita rubescens]|nr:hypothetical protein F5887DRAFT_1126325 [Amanita rubescens]
MSSATVQAKIAAFESLAGLSSSPSSTVFLPAKRSQNSSENLLETPISPTTASALPPVVQFAPRKPSKPSPSPSPPNLGRKTSLIDLRDWVVEDEFTASHLRRSQPLSILTRNGRHNGHANNGATDSSSQITAPLINLESPPMVKPKPKHLVSKPLAGASSGLHARGSLRSVASSSSLHSSSTSYLYPPLTVDRGHTYPPKPDSSHRPGHAPASSISSFHSVSLSSPSTSTSSQHITSFPFEQELERDLSVKSYGSDSVSLDESYEEVPSTSLASPATERLINLDWERATAHRKVHPPSLPRRPSSSFFGTAAPKPPVPLPLPARSTPAPPVVRPFLSASSSTSTLANSYIVPSIASRRVPPLPSRSSDRSSILSNATSDSGFSVNYATYQPSHNKTIPSSIPTVQLASIQKVRRPTPIPPKARKRYEDLFNANVVQRRKAEKRLKDMPPLLTPAEARRSRRAVGWRGLSIDLTTSGGGNFPESKAQDDSGEPVDHVVDNNETLDGRIIRCIWIRSGLDRKKLRDIWIECDPLKAGALNRESFVRGMWRIDEELRRSHTDPLKHPPSVNLYTSSSRSSGLGVARRNEAPRVPQAKAILI